MFSTKIHANGGREKTGRVTDGRDEYGANTRTQRTTVKHELTRKTKRTHDRSSVARRYGRRSAGRGTAVDNSCFDRRARPNGSFIRTRGGELTARVPNFDDTFLKFCINQMSKTVITTDYPSATRQMYMILAFFFSNAFTIRTTYSKFPRINLIVLFVATIFVIIFA